MEYTKERLKKCLALDESLVNYIDVDDIDEDLIPILIELNEKDWVTCFSCSGHIEQIKNSGRWESYIVFHTDNNTPPPNIPLYDLKSKKSKKYENEKGYNGYFYYWYGDKKKSEEEQEKERKQLMDDLLDWAKALPVNNKYIASTYIEDGWVIENGMRLFEAEMLYE